MVVIEDLHWADEASLELFPHLARKLRDVPLLLVGTYRTDELHRRHPLRPMLTELSRTRVVEDVILPRLSEDDVAAFLREAMRLGRPPTTEFRQAIFNTCEGNPLFMEEVLRALVERGDVEYRDGSWRRTKEVAEIVIPDTLRDAVLDRFRMLSPEAQAVLLRAAVIGSRFDFGILLRVTGAAEAEVVGALRAAIDAQLMLEITSDTRAPSYAFRHALTRESVLFELLQPERRRIHAAVGEAIEGQGPETSAGHAEELAYHFDEAGDRDRAFRYHDLAAREAYRLFAFSRAALHLERAIALADDREPTLGDLQLRLVGAASLAGTPQRALRAAEEARRWFQEAGDVRGAGLALTRIASYRWFLGDSRGARATADDAVRIIEPLGPTQELAAAYAQVARFAFLDFERTAAVELGRRAVEIARAQGAITIVADALITVGGAEAGLGHMEGLALQREAIDLAFAHGLPEPALRGLHNRLSALYATGSSGAEVRLAAEEEFAWARRHGIRTETVIFDEVAYMVEAGDWDAGLRVIQETYGESVFRWFIQLAEAFILAGREGPELSRPLVEAARLGLRDASPSQWLSGAGFMARATLIAGDMAATLNDLDRVATFVSRSPYPETDEAVACAIQASIELENAEARSRWIEIALAGDTSPRRIAARARRAFAQAERAASSEDLDTSIKLLGESAALFNDSFLPMAETVTRRRRAELLLGRNIGDRDAAQAELGRILPYWRRAKATWYLGQLKRWATALGLDFPVETPERATPRTREPRAQLTTREREVAALVAAGLSNKEIAEKLVISERTAEGHVEHILGKLQFRSRSQIASWQAGGDPVHPAS